MRVCVQWALSTPPGWAELDASDWVRAPKKVDPTGSSPSIDATPGWVNRVCVQGVEFTGDHYCVRPVAGGIEVTVWSDDPRYYSGGRNGEVWTFKPLRVDGAIGRRWNTHQHVARYAEGPPLAHLLANPEATLAGPVAVHPWSEFVEPPAGLVRHGVTLEDTLYQAHEDIRPVVGWREWTEGVPAEAIVDGKVHPRAFVDADGAVRIRGRR